MNRLKIGTVPRVLAIALMLSAGVHAQSGSTGRMDVVAQKPAATGLIGKWQGQTPNGMTLALDLIGDDRTFRGTLTREGETFQITDGTISKNTFTFKVTLEGEVETIEGTWQDNELKAWLTRQGPERTAVLTRVVK